jgi:hypothetical protein
MSARALLLNLPEGTDVFRNKQALSRNDLTASAPLEKGVAGWAELQGQITNCVSFQQNNKKVWKVVQFGDIGFIRGARAQAAADRRSELRVLATAEGELGGFSETDGHSGG